MTSNDSADPGRVVVLGGPAGAGKSTVSRELLERVPRCVRVDGDSLLAWFGDGLIPPWLPESHDQNRTLVAALASTAVEFARGGYVAVVDFLLGPWMIDLVEERCAAADVRLDYVILRAEPDELVRRVMARPPQFRDEAVVRKMAAEFVDVGDYADRVIDTGHGDASRTVAEIRRRLDL